MFFYDESLLITHPEIAAEWSDKNYPLKPSDVTAGCHERVWWKGKCGHEWKTGIGNRTFRNTGCPYCTTRAVLKGFNDFATLHPEFLSEWSDKNGDVKPDQFREYSNKKVWWKCKNGHEWQASCNSRLKGNGCRICGNQIVLKGFNDLESKRPGENINHIGGNARSAAMSSRTTFHIVSTTDTAVRTVKASKWLPGLTILRQRIPR